MTAPSVLIFNYTAAEQNAWRFLLRGFPGIHLLFVERSQFGLTIEQLLAGENCCAYGASFDTRMVVFCHVPDPILNLLLDVSKQVTREKAYKAVLTDSNREWTPDTLFSHLRDEEAEILKSQQT